jgi:predicted molibdopterin-dependent oxidoreductase YjgC
MTTLLGELKKRGVKVRRRGERLLLSDLHGAMTPELRAAIGAHREELLATLDAAGSTLESVDSVCPYCGVGCAIRYFVDEPENRIRYADGRESPVNHERLCVKGRFGFDYTSNPADSEVVVLSEGAAFHRSAWRAPATTWWARRLRGGAPALPRGDVGGGPGSVGSTARRDP